MTKDDIIRMAREAEGTPYVNRHYLGVINFGVNETTLVAFANLVAEREREACAAMFDDHNVWDEEVGERIRARGTT